VIRSVYLFIHQFVATSFISRTTHKVLDRFGLNFSGMFRCGPTQR